MKVPGALVRGDGPARPSIDADSPPGGRREPAALTAATAGALAAAVSLGASELIAALAGSGNSLITAVGTRFIDLGAARLKTLAVSVFGTNDKPALLVGIVLVSLGIGAALGLASRRRRWVGAVGFAAFALVGFAAGLGTPLSSATAITLAAAGGWVGGVATLYGLLRLAPQRASTSGRRAFLLAATGSGALAALAVAAGRELRSMGVADRAREALRLPAATVGGVQPAPSTQPFSVKGLTPYLTSTSDFYRIDTALITPSVDVATWQLAVKGMVDRPYSLRYQDLIAMGLEEQMVTLSCVSNEVGGDLVGNGLWRGVPLRAVLERAGVQAGATQIVGRSVDGFTVGFPTETALDGRVAMVAVGMNGGLLPVAHGFPARLVVAGLYGYVSATKWLASIELTRLEDFDAYWVPRGWSKQAPIKTQSRIDVPGDGASLKAGTVAVAGVAWAPTRGISRVEVRVDAGPWQEAELGRVASVNTWVQWMLPWDAAPGRHTLTVRATDGAGAVQDAQVHSPEPNGATGYHSRQVSVS